MKTFLTTAAIGAMLTAGAAIAMQSPAPAAPKPPLTKAEMLARADARFDRIDTNKDGQLSADERKAGMDAARRAMAEKKGGELQDFMPGRRGGGAGMGERMMKRVDTNGDGMISKAENRAMVEARFARMDADKDGTIEAGERRGPGKAKKAGERRAGAMGKRGPGGPGMMLKKADTNGDGAISKAEFDAMSAQHFAMLDTDRNGSIDAAEMQAQRDQARAMMKKMRERRGNTPPPPSPQGE